MSIPLETNRMDPPIEDKTVIVKPEKPEVKKPDPAKKAAAPTKPAQPPKRASRSGFSIVALALSAVVLAGAGSALTSIYFFSSPTAPPDDQVTQQDLTAELVPVETADDEAQDEALVRAAIEPRIINLSGDPVIVRQLSTARRQLVRLEDASQKKAASEIGVAGDIFRIKDVLDTPDLKLQAGLAGAQEDIAALNTFVPQPSDDKSIGFSAVDTSRAPTDQPVHEFAQNVKGKTSLSAALASLGVGSLPAGNAETAFARFYGQAQLDTNNRLAVRAIADAESSGTLVPVQLSVYDRNGLVGSIALDDIDHYARAADPWAGQDIFSAQLLPQDIRPEDRPRLLDAIYAAALRNNLPSAVTGEAIMLLSRAQDLEQKTQAGDTVTIVYAPEARDIKTGLGRIVYISIGRTTGNLDCYAFQAEAGAKFDCVSANGETDVPQNGMVLPVNGVIAAKFGPQQPDDKNAAGNLNFGIDWSAPEGSPVMAAYDGQVQSIGNEGSWGLVLRLNHADNKTSMYAYLQRAESGLAVGAKVTAGQIIGYVGVPEATRSARLHFELRENGVPVDPLPEAQDSAGGGGVVDQFVHRIITIESANRCDAHNPLSTAVGLGQFIEGTWMTTVRIHRPDLLVGRSRQQVLDLRLDCNLSRAMTTEFTRDNAAVMRRAGINVTPGNLYLAHFLGVGGAVKAVSGGSDRMISDVFGSAHVRANPFEAGKSLGFLVSWAARKMGAAGSATPAVVASNNQNGSRPQQASGATDQNGKQQASASTTPAPDNPMVRYDSNPAFTKLKNAVIAFLQ